MKTVTLLFATLVALAMLSVTTEAAQQYYVTDLGAFGGASHGDGSGAGAINSNGQVVGWSSIDAGLWDWASRPFLYDNGVMANLGTLGGNDGKALDVSDNGLVAGYGSDTGHGLPRAFFFNGASLVNLHALLPNPSDYSYAAGINNDGHVVGYYAVGSGFAAFLYNGSTVTELGTFGGAYSWAHAINNNGQIVGGADLPGDAAAHAFVYSGSTMTDLGTLGGTASIATAISDNGRIAGASIITGNTATHAFLSNDSSMTDLGTLGGTTSWACGVNASGQVVGFSTMISGDDYTAYPFLYDGSTMTALNQLLHPTSGWTLPWTDSNIFTYGRQVDINDSGQIAVDGIDSVGREHALRLTPITNVPESSAMIIQVTNDLDSSSSTGFSAVVDARHSGTSLGYDSGIDHDLDTSISPTDITTVVYSEIAGHRVDYNNAPEVGGYYRFCLACENPTGTDLVDVPDSLTLSDLFADPSNQSLDYEYVLSVDTDMDGNYDYVKHGLLSEVWASPDKSFGNWTQNIPAGVTLANNYYGELMLLAVAVPEPSTLSLLLAAIVAAGLSGTRCGLRRYLVTSMRY